ncbi:MAG: family 10 glycosylhydrolase, partial [Blastocatellia bacterium]
MKKFALICLLAIPLIPSQALAQNVTQYRGFWVDTFNTAFNNHNDVLAIINNVRLAKCNAIFAQVRRRGDSWYLNSLEPLADRTPIEPGFDPLADLIKEAHANDIEIHAFVIIGAIWNRSPTQFPPENPDHVFNKHGFNQAAGKIYEGRDNWLTRTLLPDDGTITFGGHRIGNEFWIDLGHPDAADYTLRVLTHLVRNYDIDGLHLDRIRYPELSVSGQTPSSGVSVGYNETSVARFQRRYGIAAGSAPPLQNEQRWNEWRRDQVTNFVRRVYLNALAIKPGLKISAALIAFGSGPASEEGWVNAESYWRVFQDWRAWTQEGILDLAIPMNYKREHQASQAAAFVSWNEWTKNHAYDRATLIGTGAFLNSVEGTIRQVRSTFAPSMTGNRSVGAVFFSFANANDVVTANPLSNPAGRDTPRRSFAEFASGLVTGKSVDGTQSYEGPGVIDAPVFADEAMIPVLNWKQSPRVGHLMGIVKILGQAADSVEVQISRIADGVTPPAGRTSVTTTTDGNGFYGAVDLAPGSYRVMITPVGGRPDTFECGAVVAEGLVTSFDVTISQAIAGPNTRFVRSVSAASYCGNAVTAESIVAGFGSTLAASTQAATAIPLPTTLAGASVNIKDSADVERLAPLFFVSPGQINYLVPSGVALGQASVFVLGSGDIQGGINIVKVAPALFAANADGLGVPAGFALRVRSDG